MGYTPTEWKSGDVVTSAKLNKLEQGVAASGGGSAFIVHVTTVGATSTLDKTYSEIYDALLTHIVLISEKDDIYGALSRMITCAYEKDGVYSVESPYCYVDNNSVSWEVTTYTTDSEDGYPSFTVTLPR